MKKPHLNLVHIENSSFSENKIVLIENLLLATCYLLLTNTYPRNYEFQTRCGLYRFFLLPILGLLTSCQSLSSITPPILPGEINSNFPEESPAYSSDGNYLVFASDRRGQRDIFLYDVPKKQLVSLPNLNHRNSSQDRPAIDANGRYIVYVSTERGKADIFLYDRQRQKSELLSANIKGSVDNPTINGDGSQIAFQASQTGQWKIVLINRAF